MNRDTDTHTHLKTRAAVRQPFTLQGTSAYGVVWIYVLLTAVISVEMKGLAITLVGCSRSTALMCGWVTPTAVC
jgi:hypothetical protein